MRPDDQDRPVRRCRRLAQGIDAPGWPNSPQRLDEWRGSDGEPQSQSGQRIGLGHRTQHQHVFGGQRQRRSRAAEFRDTLRRRQTAFAGICFAQAARASRKKRAGWVVRMADKDSPRSDFSQCPFDDGAGIAGTPRRLRTSAESRLRAGERPRSGRIRRRLGQESAPRRPAAKMPGPPARSIRSRRCRPEYFRLASPKRRTRAARKSCDSRSGYRSSRHGCQCRANAGGRTKRICVGAEIDHLVGRQSEHGELAMVESPMNDFAGRRLRSCLE